MRKAVFAAFLLVLGSAALGATVLREPIAWAATTPFQQVIVTNDKTAPVPVSEQNVDAAGAIQVSDQSGREATRYEGPANASFQAIVPAVPDGTRFVISYINVWGSSGIDTTIVAEARCLLLKRTTEGGVTSTGAFAALPMYFSGRSIAASEQMTLPVEAGESIGVSCSAQPNPASFFAEAVVVGNYVPA